MKADELFLPLLWAVLDSWCAGAGAGEPAMGAEGMSVGQLEGRSDQLSYHPDQGLGAGPPRHVPHL